MKIRTESEVRGTRLRDARLRRGWTVKEAAERAGVAPMSVYGAESGRRLPTALTKLADLYELTSGSEPAESPLRSPTTQGRPRMSVPEALAIAEEEALEEVVDYATAYEYRQEERAIQREREAAYLLALAQDPDHSEQATAKIPPIGYLVPDLPPPPPPPQPRPDLYRQLMNPR